MSAALGVPDSPPSVPCPAGLAPPPCVDTPDTASPAALARAELGHALAHLAAQRHLLAKAQEWAREAERTHTEPVTGLGGRLYVRAHPYSPEDIARRRTHAAARVAECKRRVEAAYGRVECAMWAMSDLSTEVVF